MRRLLLLALALLAISRLAGAELKDQAITLLRQGRTVEAERLMLSHVAQTRTSFGERDPRYAKALFELATIRLALEDAAGAVEVLRQAAAVPPTDQQGRRDQITYEWNLGQILARATRLAEAVEVLRANLRRREAFYGRQHAGYAFGLNVLCEVLWINHQSAEAAPLITEAVANLARNQQQEQWEACVLQGVIRCDLQPAPPRPFDALVGADAGQFATATAKMQDLMHCRPASETLPMAMAFRDACVDGGAARLAHADLAQRLVVDLAIKAQRNDHRLHAMQWLVDHHQQADDDAVDLRMGLANAFEARHDRVQQLAWYDKACVLAATRPGPCFPRTLRNAGLGYRDAKDAERGEALLRQALAVARERQLPEEIGRACIALGVTLQHAKRPAETKALLSEGVQLLPLLDADMVCGYSHLRSVEMGLDNCCDASGSYAIERALSEFIDRHVAAGIVASVESTAGDITVRTTRQPTADEQALLDRIIIHARAALRRVR